MSGIAKNGCYLNHTRSKKSGLAKMSYLRVSAGPQRDTYLHRLVAEAMLMRPLEPGEAVDHIDGNTMNNHPSNLRVMTMAMNTRLRNGEKPDLEEIVFDGSLHFGKGEHPRG